MKLNDTNLALPPQQVSLDVLIEKYAKGGHCSIPINPVGRNEAACLSYPSR